MISATYGHGTHNDFVLIFDPENKLNLNANQIKRICDRNLGIGSDGLIKIIKQNQSWFMDHYNADGTQAEMCGNGIRVVARYLTDSGHQPSGIYPINTRDGRKFLSVPQVGDISVNMGKVSLVSGDVCAGHLGSIWHCLYDGKRSGLLVPFVECFDSCAECVFFISGIALNIVTGKQIGRAHV